MAGDTFLYNVKLLTFPEHPSTNILKFIRDGQVLFRYAKAAVNYGSVLSVRPASWKNWASADRTAVWFYIGELHQNLWRTFKFCTGTLRHVDACASVTTTFDTSVTMFVDSNR